MLPKRRTKREEKLAFSAKMAKLLMKSWESFPTPPSDNVTGSSGVFNDPTFVDGTKERRKAMMLSSSEVKYREEREYPWDHYFGIDLHLLLSGKTVLDLGCFTGGRGAAWFERHELGHLVGIDVAQTYIDAARQFAAVKEIDAEYFVGRGEALPLHDELFDAVLSFDVFEHVRDLGQTLDECWRVLKPRGKLFAVFPGYYHPTEHHLSQVTKLPCLHYFFSSRALISAYYAVQEARGDDARWCRRSSPEPECWERSNGVNGTTLAGFRRLLRNGRWDIVLHSRRALGSVGRNISKVRAARAVSWCLHPLTFVPGLQEICLHRITYVLEKVD